MWLDLPFPTSANRMWRHNRGRTMLSPEYAAWREHAALMIKVAGKCARVEGPYALHILAGRPHGRIDLDNIIKPTSDALARGLMIENDRLAQTIEAKWVSGLEGIRVLVLPTAKVPA